MADASRRFPAPWRADKIAGGYVVRDANGQALAYLYSRDNEAEARQAKIRSEDQGTLGGGAGSKKCATTTAARTAMMANPIAS
jgi:hypothetical protein